MANEFKHKDPGTALTQAEYISASGCGHIFACQATGDILYASSTTVLKNLGKGAANTVLSMGGSCIPAWTASPSVTDLTIGGGCITLSAATDIDLLDNNASALSFDASGKTGIIDIVTTNSSEGVTMSGTLGVTGVVTASAGVVIDNVTYDACAITATAAFTIDATTDIVLDADGDNITFKAGSGDTTGLDFSNSSGTWTVKAGTSDSDLIFNVNDGGVDTKVMTILGADAVVTFGGNSVKSGEIRILEDTSCGTNYVAIKSGNVSTSYTITLPTAVAGGNCYVLTSTNAGVTSWAASSSVCAANQAEQEAACITNKYTSPGTQKFHPGTAKGWAEVRQGASHSLIANYNVSCVGDCGAGRTQVNWCVDFSSNDYAAPTGSDCLNHTRTTTVTTCSVDLLSSNNCHVAEDSNTVYVVAFGAQ